MKEGKRYENPVYELIKLYQPDFIDCADTVIIIDEIQESADIYNRIREFTRSLKSDFIITGSYLGRILNKEFKYSADDLDTLEIQTLNFEEFLMAMGKEKNCYITMEKIIHLFTNESKRYFEDILDYTTYENIFTSIARILVKEKKD